MKRIPQLLWLVVAIGCAAPETSTGLFEPGVALGVNHNKQLEESSGLVASSKFPGRLWAHNDSGHAPEIFLLDSTAQTQASFRISGAVNRDWEDICRLSTDTASYLFIGDIGDNSRRHGLKVIYCVPEPDRLEGLSELTPTKTITIHLAGGYRDMEALMADPLTQNLYLISKREHAVRVYEVAFPYPDDTVHLDHILEIPVSKITAADISPDGSEILMKNYTDVFYWKRNAGQTVVEALKAPPLILPYEREPQGESIAWAIDGSGYYTLSENGKGERGKLYFYPRTDRADTPAN